MNATVQNLEGTFLSIVAECAFFCFYRYITKPVDLDDFISIVKAIQDFWLTIVKLPPERE